MSIKVKILISILVIGTSYAFGRYTAPEKIKTIEVEKKVDTSKTDAEKNVHKKTTVTKTTKPDGTVTEVTEITDESVISKKKTTTDTVTDSKSTEITKSSGILTIEGMVSLDVKQGSVWYGAHISRNLLGPIRIGAFGLTSGTAGVTVGLDF